MAMADTTVGAVLILFLCFGVPISATDYQVGDSSGWTQGVDYMTWTSGKTFLVGDNLVFNYDSNTHSVYEVSSPSDYSSCSTTSSLNSDTNSGASTIKLATPGAHYFICGTQSHCSGGMKMSLTVSSPAPSGAPPTTPISSSNIPPPSTTTPPSTTNKSSSAISLRPGVLCTNLAVVAIVAVLGALLA